LELGTAIATTDYELCEIMPDHDITSLYVHTTQGFSQNPDATLPCYVCTARSGCEVGLGLSPKHHDQHCKSIKTATRLPVSTHHSSPPLPHLNNVFRVPPLTIMLARLPLLTSFATLVAADLKIYWYSQNVFDPDSGSAAYGGVKFFNSPPSCDDFINSSQGYDVDFDGDVSDSARGGYACDGCDINKNWNDWRPSRIEINDWYKRVFANEPYHISESANYMPMLESIHLFTFDSYCNGTVAQWVTSLG
jgi:hypothetical protein